MNILLILLWGAVGAAVGSVLGDLFGHALFGERFRVGKHYEIDWKTHNPTIKACSMYMAITFGLVGLVLGVWCV